MLTNNFLCILVLLVREGLVRSLLMLIVSDYYSISVEDSCVCQQVLRLSEQSFLFVFAVVLVIYALIVLELLHLDLGRANVARLVVIPLLESAPDRKF